MCAFIGGRAETCGDVRERVARECRTDKRRTGSSSSSSWAFCCAELSTRCRLPIDKAHTRSEATVECARRAFSQRLLSNARTRSHNYSMQMRACACVYVCVYARHRLCCAPASDFSSHNLRNDCIICNVVHYRCARPLGDDGNGVCTHARTRARTHARKHVLSVWVSKSAL